MLRLEDQNVFQKSAKGRGAFNDEVSILNTDRLHERLPKEFLRKGDVGLPEISERDVVFHYSHLASRTFSVDKHFYPLGSCTMKYNPKVNEAIANLPGFAHIHPLQDDCLVPGALEVLFDLQEKLSFICGMDAFSLQPAAGAQGELTALMMAKHYFLEKGIGRTKVVIPDSSHGTNAASAALCGFDVVTIPSKEGEIDLEALKAECDSTLAVFMTTNPNTLGLFEKDILEANKLVHDCGGLSYCDGANLNALLGISKPGEMGFDMMHVNVHKTLSTPHGGGGPGAGPVGVKSFLEEYLPSPMVLKTVEGVCRLDFEREKSIGMVKTFWGNFGVLLRASTYIDSLGLRGLKETSVAAVLNANYLKEKLKDLFPLAFEKPCMHEFVVTPHEEKSPLRAMDLAKMLLDYGMHAPTVYFPLIVKEAIMIEPTETESLPTLNEFVSILKEIANEARENPDKIKNAPEKTYRSRLDEVQAARKPILKWNP